MFIVRYMQEIPAYHEARRFFLAHPEYDYFVIATDDIVVKPEDVERLDYSLTVSGVPVLSGWMNVDQHEYNQPDGNINICYELAIKDKKLRHYNWIKRGELPDKEYFQVKFAGFGLTAIRRDVIEKIEFAGDGIFKGHGMSFGASLDFVFCWNCHELGIPVWVDRKIDLQHLRTSGEHQVGKRKPFFEHWTERGIESIRPCCHPEANIVYQNNRMFRQCPHCKSFI